MIEIIEKIYTSKGIFCMSTFIVFFFRAQSDLQYVFSPVIIEIMFPLLSLKLCSPCNHWNYCLFHDNPSIPFKNKTCSLLTHNVPCETTQSQACITAILDSCHSTCTAWEHMQVAQKKTKYVCDQRYIQQRKKNETCLLPCSCSGWLDWVELCCWTVDWKVEEMKFENREKYYSFPQTQISR